MERAAVVPPVPPWPHAGAPADIWLTIPEADGGEARPVPALFGRHGFVLTAGRAAVTLTAWTHAG
jgi:hypothetical protein